VCSAGLIRKTIELQHLAGQSVRSIAADPGVAAAGLHESSLRRHLTGGHQLTSNRFTPAALDDDDFTAADAVAGVARGIRKMLQLRDAPGTAATSAIRAQAEARAGIDSLARAGVVDGERLAAKGTDWESYSKAERALANDDPDDTERRGHKLVELGHREAGTAFIKLAESVRERKTHKEQ